MLKRYVDIVFAVCIRGFPIADGDKKAYYENTQWEMQRNRVKIQQMRDENKQLRDRLSRKVAVSPP